MRLVVSYLASLKLTVCLLVALCLAMATGSIVESTRGAAVARAFYHSPGFMLLLVLYGVNLLASVIDRWPYGRWRVGFLLTHSSMLVILIGALMSVLFGVNARIAIWEGESTREAAIFDDRGKRQGSVELPFEVKLDEFEIDVYQGTSRPAMFRSRVTVTGPGDESFPAIIEMNRELSHAGFSLFQSSYQRTPERDLTVLSVARDPGQPVVFLGFVLLVVGQCTVLITRVIQRRGLPTPQATVAALMAIALLGPLAARTAAASELSGLQLADQLRTLPVQHDGRVMPLDTLARESVWRVTGQRKWRGADPVELVLAWRFDQARWEREPLVEVDGKELTQAIGVRTGHASFRAIVDNPKALELMREARHRRQAEEPLDARHEQAAEVEQRLIRLQEFFSGDTPLVVPHSSDPVAAWAHPHDVSSAAALIEVAGRVRAEPPDFYPSVAEMDREVLYNRLRPTRLAWLLLVASLVVAIAGWSKKSRVLDIAMVALLLLGFAVMSWGIALRWQVAGRIPASNMYESMLFLAWGVGLFAVIASAVGSIRGQSNRLVVVNALAMSALTMLLTDLLPIDSFIHPMQPVLSGTPWLAIHVPIIMVSYSVFALGVAVAHARLGLELFAPGKERLARRMDDLLYWYVHVGTILLAAGIITGSIWAASSWGRYWGWDPKEVWSLIAFLAYMAILHGRFDRFIGNFGVALLSIVAFWTILMTYLGVNYVLAAGLHSYGFGGGAVVRSMSIGLLIELAFLGTAGVMYWRRTHPPALRSPQ